MTQEILFEIREGIGLLTVNRPEVRNALNWSAQEQFARTVRQCTTHPSLRALIITGAGDKAFVAGGDIKELMDHQEYEAGERLNRVMSSALHELTQLPIPVIAAVNGDAIGGGCEILTACDLRIAAAHSKYRFAQIRVGLTTGWGGTGRLVRLIGQSRASDWLLTGRTIDAIEAERSGFINRLIPDEMNLLEITMELTLALTRLPQQALAATKYLINDAGYLPLSKANQEEKRLFTQLWSTRDRLEAMQSIAEKREPDFRHLAE